MKNKRKVLYTGTYIPGNSFIHRMNSLAKTLCFFFLATACIITGDIAGYLIIMIMLLIIIKLSALPIRAVFHTVIRLRFFFIFILIINSFFYSSENPLYTFGIINITLEGIFYGLRILFNIFYITSLANILTAATSPMEICSSLTSILKPLKIFRINIENISMILSISLRFIPSLLDEAELIKKAQISRGAKFESRKIRDKIQSYLQFLVPVFISAFRRADDLSLAMEARGYSSHLKRTKKRGMPFRIPDYIALGCSITTCIFQILFKVDAIW